ncbi:MAG: hypothetical protein MZW92_22800 [Comamonadaceae bacterium]|nr:hypothetical protein [Comamonadaceae bacterium]
MPGFARPPAAPCRAAALATACLAAAPLAAQQPTDQPQEPAAEVIVVTGSIAERRLLDAPYAIGVVGRDALRQAGPMVNLSRGDGAGAGHRGRQPRQLRAGPADQLARLRRPRRLRRARHCGCYADGIPASGPDGQGQVVALRPRRRRARRGAARAVLGAVRQQLGRRDLGRSARRCASAGARGRRRRRQPRPAPAARRGCRRRSATASICACRGSTMDWDGFRPHSAAERDLAQRAAGLARASATASSLLLSALDQPARRPAGPDARAVRGRPATRPRRRPTPFDTRKDARRRTQVGVQLAPPLQRRRRAARDRGSRAYAGRRSVTQWLAIPARSTQDRPERTAAA